MKIFWWQAGLHFEPETKAEIDALMILWESKRILPEVNENGVVSSGCVIDKKLSNSIIGD
jgi:ADP-glucose pyrophosphorylase